MAIDTPPTYPASKPSSEVAPLVNFTVFSKLPPELRDTIWNFAITDIRVLKITNKVLSKISLYKLYARHYTPPLLHTNRESRTVALKFYTPAFSSRLDHPIYFDFARDYLYLDIWTIWDFHKSSIDTANDEVEEALVTHLMVAKQVLSSLNILRICASLFPSLKSLDVENEDFHANDPIMATLLRSHFEMKLRQERAELFPGGMTEMTEIKYWTLKDMEDFAERSGQDS